MANTHEFNSSKELYSGSVDIETWQSLANDVVNGVENDNIDMSKLCDLGRVATNNPNIRPVPHSVRLSWYSEMFSIQQKYDLAMLFEEAAEGREILPARQAS